MEMIKNTIVAVALALSVPALAETAPDVTKVEQIASGICAGCHNADGNSVIPMNPILAGQHAEYITKQLSDFKATESEPAKRNSPVMSSMVATLLAEDMKNLGAYYAKQKTNPRQVTTEDKSLLEVGKIIYHAGSIENGVPACASCHGPTGAGVPPHYPALAGQHAEYTLAQLSLFNTGDRSNDNGVMQKVLTRMNPSHKRAVSAYISTMR